MVNKSRQNQKYHTSKVKSKIAELGSIKETQARSQNMNPMDELNLMRTLIDSIPHPICVKDTDGRFIFFNKTFIEGRDNKDPQVVLGKTDADFMPESYAKLFRSHEQEIIKSGQPKINYEEFGIGADGTTKWSLTTKAPIKDKNGNVVALSVMNRVIGNQQIVKKVLKDSVVKYQAFYEGVAEGIIVADVKTKQFLYANPAICKMLGYTEDELTAFSLKDIHPEQNLPYVLAEFESQARGEKDTALDIPCLCKDGSVMYAYVNVARVQVEGRSCLVGFFTDVTELKKTQAILAESEKKLRLILDQSSDGINIIEYDRKTGNRKVILCNDSYAQMAGRSKQELMALDDVTNLTVHHGDQGDLIDYHQFIREQIPYRGQCSWLRPDKKENYIDWSAVSFYDDDDRVYVIGIDRDITDQKKKQQLLNKAESQYRTLVEQIPAVTYIASLDNPSVKTYFSPQVEAILGYTPRQFEDNPWLWEQSLHCDDQKSVLKQLKNAVKNKKKFCCEYRMKTSDGGSVWLRDEASIVNDDKNKPLFLQGVIIDITARKQMEDKLLKVKDELEVRVKLRTSDLEKVNKKLMDEITARKHTQAKLYGYQDQLRSMASELSLAEERTRRQIATDVHDHIGQNLAMTKMRLQQLQQQIYDKSQKNIVHDIQEIITNTIESIRTLTFEISPPVLYELGFEPAVEWLLRKSRKQHGLDTDFTNDARHKPLDDNVKVFLFQSVRELLINVAKHAKATKVSVDISRVKNTIETMVSDNGTGFDIDHVYEQKYNHGGFGLFSIKERLSYIGGDLRINSKPGKGTSVTLIASLTLS